MIVVMDASGALEIALEKENGKEFRDIVKSADLVVAPDCFISEVTKAFWKYRQFAQFTDDKCLSGIEFCVNLIDDFLFSNDLWREAYREGVINQTSTYDMFYLVAARRNSAVLISMDKKLNQLAEVSEIRTTKSQI